MVTHLAYCYCRAHVTFYSGHRHITRKVIRHHELSFPAILMTVRKAASEIFDLFFSLRYNSRTNASLEELLQGWMDSFANELLHWEELVVEGRSLPDHEKRSIEVAPLLLQTLRGVHARHWNQIIWEYSKPLSRTFFRQDKDVLEVWNLAFRFEIYCLEN